MSIQDIIPDAALSTPASQQAAGDDLIPSAALDPRNTFGVAQPATTQSLQTPTGATAAGYPRALSPQEAAIAAAHPELAPGAVPRASIGDLAQSVESGVNAGGLDLLGLPMDFSVNALNLGKAGLGYGESLLTGRAPSSAFDVIDPANIVGTSEWLKRQASDLSPSSVNVTGDPKNPDLAALHTGAEVLGPGIFAEAGNAAIENAAVPRGAGPIEEGHPLTVAAKAEAGKLQAATDAAQEYGLTLPPREVSLPQQYVDDAARRDLNLPAGAPITSGLLDAARTKNVGPAYNAARQVPEFTTGPKYKAAISGVDLSKIDPIEVTAADGTVRQISPPPPGGTLNGADAVELSRGLRNEASQWSDYADRSGDPTASRTAARYRAAAKAVEAGFREGVTAQGQPQIADNWDAARTYAAKTYAWEDTLDGAGHASGPKVAKLQRAGEPVTGPMQEAASVVAQYPELFRSTRLATPQPGLIKRGAAALAPAAGAAAGSLLGPPGAIAGELAGRALADRILP